MSVVEWVYYYVLLYDIVYPFSYAHRLTYRSDQNVFFTDLKLGFELVYTNLDKKTFSSENLLDMCNGARPNQIN